MTGQGLLIALPLTLATAAPNWCGDQDQTVEPDDGVLPAESEAVLELVGGRAVNGSPRQGLADRGGGAVLGEVALDVRGRAYE